MKGKRYSACLLVVAGLVAQPVVAEDKVKPCKAENKEDCKNARADNTKELPLVSVTANRMETDIATYAGQISILDDNDLDYSDNFIKNMSTIPGVQTGDDWGRSIGSQFRIRGFGYQSENRVIIEQDGVKRSPSLFSNHISTFRVDNDLLKRAEVIKGASSILHGSGAIGGIVSMQTKEARDFINKGKNVGFTLGSRIESNNLKSGRMALAFDPESAPIDLLIYGKRSSLGDTKLADGGYMDSDDMRVDEVHNDEDIQTSYIKGGWDITPEMRLTLSAYRYQEDLITTWQTLWHTDPGEAPVNGDLSQSDYIAEYTWQPVDNDLIDLSARIYKSDASYHRTREGISRGKPFAIDYENEDKRQGLALKNQATFTTGSLKHALVAGIDYDKREEDAVFVYNGELSDFGSFPNYYKDFGFYIQDTIGIGRFDLTLGGRYDRFKRGVDLPGKASYSDKHFSPKISTAYEVMEGVNLLAGYAETFRGPTPNETSADGALNPHYWYVPNTDLLPETAKEFEVGFSVDRRSLFSPDDSLYIKTTYFDGKIEDMISLRRAPEFGTPPNDDGYDRDYAQYQNISNARRRGVEIEGRYHMNNWHFSAGYEHLKLYNEATGKRIDDYADKLTLSSSYLYQPWGLNAGIQATHWFRPTRDQYTFVSRGKTYNYINRAFTIIDLKGNWQPRHTNHSFFDDGFKLTFGINNLLDKKYIHPSNREDTSMVGKGRNYYVGFEKTF